MSAEPVIETATGAHQTYRRGVAVGTESPHFLPVGTADRVGHTSHDLAGPSVGHLGFHQVACILECRSSCDARGG